MDVVSLAISNSCCLRPAHPSRSEPDARHLLVADLLVQPGEQGASVEVFLEVGSQQVQEHHAVAEFFERGPAFTRGVGAAARDQVSIQEPAEHLGADVAVRLFPAGHDVGVELRLLIRFRLLMQHVGDRETEDGNADPAHDLADGLKVLQDLPELACWLFVGVGARGRGRHGFRTHGSWMSRRVPLGET